MRGSRTRTPRKSSAGPPALSPPSGAPALGYARDVDTSVVGHGRALAVRPGGRDWIGDSTRETIKWSVRMMSGARRGDELWVGRNGGCRVYNQSEKHSRIRTLVWP